jgi:hypothetical protein
MNEPTKAQRLSEVARFIDVEPLGWGDPRYVNLSDGRGPRNELDLLKRRLFQHDARDNRYAKIAFTGTRGGGKTTELLRLEQQVSHRFTPLHVYVDESLYGGCGFAELFLWIVDELVQKFERDKTPLDARLVEQVARWFFDVSVEQTDKVVSEITAEAEAKVGGKASLFWLSLGLFARLKSQIKGSTDRRKEIRGKLQQRASDLVARVNELLDNAQGVLTRHGNPGNPADLLIVVDNLDRLEPQVSSPLFFESGDILKQPKAHFIYTVPSAIDLAPMNIGTVFGDKFTLSTVKVRGQNGRAIKKGIDALVQLVAERIDVDAVFAKPRDVRKLAEMSGGSLRDLMRLLLNAQLLALADEREMIESTHVKEAVDRLRLDYEKSLFPGWAYYPILARIHRSKSELGESTDVADPEKARRYCDVFSKLLFSSSVLAYNGEDVWYDVHPVIQEIDAFKDAFKRAQSDAQAASKPETGEGQARRE